MGDDRNRSAAEPANVYRESYTEEDINVLIASPRFLVAVDACGAGRCTLEQMLKLAFAEPPYIPPNLSVWAFSGLVFELIRRIKAGELLVPDEWKKEYPHFYNQQRPAPLDELPAIIPFTNRLN